jgi:hypothetical protein
MRGEAEQFAILIALDADDTEIFLRGDKTLSDNSASENDSASDVNV